MIKTATISTPQQLNSYVRALRKARGLTQRDVAQMLGVSAMRVATIEKDIGRVSTASVLSLIQLLGGSLELSMPVSTEIAQEQEGRELSIPPAGQSMKRRGEW